MNLRILKLKSMTTNQPTDRVFNFLNKHLQASIFFHFFSSTFNFIVKKKRLNKSLRKYCFFSLQNFPLFILSALRLNLRWELPVLAMTTSFGSVSNIDIRFGLSCRFLQLLLILYTEASNLESYT